MKIAIIGTGITGNSAAWLLHPHHDITVYEKEAQPGGHSRTRTVTLGGHNVSVDTGFIVFNRRNYPLLDGWFKHLGVPVQDSNMSFAFTAESGALEFSSRSLMGIFPEFASLLEPRRYAMLLDYFRFARYARRFLREQRSLPLGEALRRIESFMLEEWQAADRAGRDRFGRDHGVGCHGLRSWRSPRSRRGDERDRGRKRRDRRHHRGVHPRV